MKPKVTEQVKASQHESYNSLTIVSALFPLIGLILGVSYLTKDSKLDRKLGEHLLGIAIMFSLVAGILWTMYVYGSGSGLTY